MNKIIRNLLIIIFVYFLLTTILAYQIEKGGFNIINGQIRLSYIWMRIIMMSLELPIIFFLFFKKGKLGTMFDLLCRLFGC